MNSINLTKEQYNLFKRDRAALTGFLKEQNIKGWPHLDYNGRLWF
jgi:hypothetical protein